jgi:hypothetical protein
LSESERELARKKQRKGYMIVVSEVRVKDICENPSQFNRGKVYRKKSTALKQLRKNNLEAKLKGWDIGDKIIKWPPKCLVR